MERLSIQLYILYVMVFQPKRRLPTTECQHERFLAIRKTNQAFHAVLIAFRASPTNPEFVCRKLNLQKDLFFSAKIFANQVFIIQRNLRKDENVIKMPHFNHYKCQMGLNVCRK